MLKTVIIGAGNIAYPHARALHTLGIGIAGVLDVNMEHAQTLADAYGSKAIRSLDEVLEEADMVHVLTPPSKRVEYVRQASVAGKHIFIEKPIAVSVDEAKEINAMAAQGNVKLMVGYNHRFRRGYRMLQEAVLDGRIGDVISVFSHRMGAGRGFDGTPVGTCWRTQSGNVCGMSIESISHEIDMLLHLAGGVTSVSANTFGTMKELPDFDNNVSVSFRLKNGGTGSINASWSSHIGYSARGVIGTKGTAMVTGDGQFNFLDFVIKTSDMLYETVIRVNDRFEAVSDRFESDSYLAVNGHFKECIEQNIKPEVSGEDGVKALTFSQAILESSRTLKAVAVDL